MQTVDSGKNFEKSLEFMQKANKKIIELSTFDKHAKANEREKSSWEKQKKMQA